MVWDWFAGALKKIGSLLLRPKDQNALKDQSFRQTNILSKTRNTFFVLNPRTAEMLIGDYSSLPPEVLDLILGRADPQKALEQGQPQVRLFRNDFHDEVIEFQAHVAKEDELLRTISRYIEPTFASVFRLGSYAKEFYDRNERRKGDEIKAQVGHQYGSDGRKLCNLYIKSYILDMVNHYLGSIIESARDKREIGVRLNRLIRSLIRSSEHIFFIHQGSNIKETTGRIRSAVLSGVPYIALHSAGVRNISRTTKIIDAVDVDYLEENGFDIIQEKPPSTASIPFFDVYITPHEQREQDEP